MGLPAHPGEGRGINWLDASLLRHHKGSRRVGTQRQCRWPSPAPRLHYHIAYGPFIYTRHEGKAGEYRALQALAPEVHAALRPLLELLPAGPDVVDFAAAQVRALSRSRPHDITYVDLHSEAGWAQPAVAAYFREARALGLPVIPVAGLDATDGYAAAVGEAADRDGRGVAVRVRPHDVVSGAFRARNSAFLERFQIQPVDVDLVLDVGEILPDQVAQAQLAAVALLRAAEPIARWRSATLVGAAFPVDLRGLSADSVTLLPRADWTLWQAVRASAARDLGFGDYAIAHPVLMTGFDPVTMQMSGSIRYTTQDAWLVAKGRSTRRAGWEQMRTVAARLRSRPEFCGPTFSWGDRFIADCADGLTTTGNATTWRKVGTNHHLTFVVRQLSTLPAP